jgi:hypothetical protein
MNVEQWGMTETARFRHDVLHYQPSEALLRSWRENIRHDPMIGRPAEDGTGIGEHDYVVGDLVIRYIVVPEQRHVILMTLRQKSDLVRHSRSSAGKIWGVLMDLLRLWNGLKWW